MDDLISRQAAIRWVKTECNPYGKPTLEFESGKRVIEHLEQMPSAQPKSYREGYQAGFKDAQPETAERTAETAQNISDDDLISRKAAMNRIDEALARVFVDSHGCGETALRGLPSVKLERKRGHWVGIDDEPCETWECDQCGYIQEFFDGDQPNYCPNCGADMRGEQDESYRR